MRCMCRTCSSSRWTVPVSLMSLMTFKEANKGQNQRGMHPRLIKLNRAAVKDSKDSYQSPCSSCHKPRRGISQFVHLQNIFPHLVSLKNLLILLWWVCCFSLEALSYIRQVFEFGQNMVVDNGKEEGGDTVC